MISLPSITLHTAALWCVFWGTSTQHTGSDPVNKLGDDTCEHVLVAATPGDWVNGSIFVQVVGAISE